MTNQIKVLIVEDEFAVALDVQNRLQKMEFEVVGIVSNFTDAISTTATESLDVVVMDINISGDKTGIDAAKVIWQKFEVPIVYLTGVSEPELMEEALSTMPMGYILKPFNDNTIHSQLMIAVQQKKALQFLREKVKHYENVMSSIVPDKSNNEILFIKDSKQIFQLPVKEIAYLEAMDNYTLLYTSKDQKYVMNGFLKDIIDKISNTGIIRIHRSYAIAKQHIKQIEENTVSVGTRILPISKSYRDSFYEAINPI